MTAHHTYEGNYGHSLRVRGLEPGVNDNAWIRDIVLHPDLRMTQSAGCFMLPELTSNSIIDAIVSGSFVYVHRSLDVPGGSHDPLSGPLRRQLRCPAPLKYTEYSGGGRPCIWHRIDPDHRLSTPAGHI